MIEQIAIDSDYHLLGLNINYLSDLAEGIEDLLSTPHAVEFHALILVTEGSGAHCIDGKTYHCRPGTLFILSPHQVHHFESSPAWNGYVVSFDNSQIFPIDNLDANYALTKAIQSVDVMTEVMDLVGSDFRNLYNEFHSPLDFVSSHMQRNMLQNILYKIFFRTNYCVKETYKSKEVEDYQLFRDEVERSFAFKHNVTDYTESLHFTIKRLNTVCRKVKNMTAKEIIDARILLEAKRLIGYTSRPISEIAVSLGFNEPTNLAKFFRRHTNISPSEYRSMSKFFSE